MTAKELIDLFDSKNGTRVLPIFNYISEHYPTFNHPEIDLGDELFKALTSYDQLVKEHELTIKLFNSANEQLNELERDVKRFMELYNPPQPDDEYDILRVKLSKLGKEE